MKKKYDVLYFIEKFEAIPEERWYTGEFTNPYNPKQKCALGHCEGSSLEEGTERCALSKLRLPYSVGMSVVRVNDGLYSQSEDYDTLAMVGFENESDHSELNRLNAIMVRQFLENEK